MPLLVVTAAKPGSPTYTEALQSNTVPPVPPKSGGEIKNTVPRSPTISGRGRNERSQESHEGT
jgi:hypothetical protein